MAGLEAPGLDRVAAGLRDAGAQVADLKPANQTVADQILVRARPVMPRRTGALVASMRAVGTATDATITVGVPYARPVLFGAPRAGRRGARVTPIDVVENTRAQWLDVYTEHAAAACKNVRGD